ncbi:Dyrk2 [Scenedesmus sp. PABB004]|nr:Dyrk2 [Scenedesmus sp. PABB004]
MGNAYSGAKPALPSLNLNKVRGRGGGRGAQGNAAVCLVASRNAAAVPAARGGEHARRAAQRTARGALTAPAAQVKASPDAPDDLYAVGSAQRNVLPAARLPGGARKLPQQLIAPGGVGPDGTLDHGRLLANNIVPKPVRMEPDAPHSARGAAGSLPHVGAPPRVAATSRPAAYAAAAPPAATDAIRTAPAVETGPITPAQALKRYGEYLTPFEQSEILQYSQVWFLGKADVAKVRGNPHLAKTNYGYDDERGDYVAVPRDHIAYRYEVAGVLGKGSFGQAQVELKVLEHLRANDAGDTNHVIHIQEHFTFRSHLCITFELLGSNLYEFIKANNFAGLDLTLIHRFAGQMLVALRFLSDHRLIHCDLKPENVLLLGHRRPGVKVIDFGSSCFAGEQLYTYVQSRFYRSPEVILGLPYGVEIDMWSFGCILAELFMGYPLFPGEDETEQLLCIMEAMGPPPPRLLEAASRRKTFFDASGAPTVVPNSRGKIRTPGSKSLWGVLRCQDAGFVDLLERCLRWDPAERLTPAQAAAHPWMVERAAAAAAAAAAAGSPAASHRGRGRTDQAHASPGRLQPTSVIAAALSASGPVGKAAARAMGLGAGGGRDGGGPSALCSGEAGAGAGFGGGLGAPAAHAAGAGGWAADAGGAAGSSRMPRALHGGGAPDTVQSGFDCTPRQLSQTAAAALSAAAPALGAGGGGRPAPGGGGGGGFTPRSMETNAPALPGRGYGAKQVAVGVLAAGGAAQVVVAQRSSGGGRDVHGPDQAALVAASNALKVQAGPGASLATKQAAAAALQAQLGAGGHHHAAVGYLSGSGGGGGGGALGQAQQLLLLQLQQQQQLGGGALPRLQR